MRHGGIDKVSLSEAASDIGWMGQAQTGTGTAPWRAVRLLMSAAASVDGFCHCTEHVSAPLRDKRPPQPGELPLEGGRVTEPQAFSVNFQPGNSNAATVIRCRRSRLRFSIGQKANRTSRTYSRPQVWSFLMHTLSQSMVVFPFGCHFFGPAVTVFSRWVCWDLVPSDLPRLTDMDFHFHRHKPLSPSPFIRITAFTLM